MTALLASHVIPSSIGLGPVYLLICAISAWFVGNRFAVMLWVLFASLQFVTGKPIIFRATEAAIFVDSAVQLCSALAVILMLGVAREALEIEWRYARLDPLTGALNRKAFFEAAKSEADQGNMAVIVFADIDGLKHLNDRSGHEAGDMALRDFAARVRSAIRKTDIFARVGGDEFVILLKVPDNDAAKVVVERLNRVVNFDLDDHVMKLKCSLGILFLPAGTKSIDAELKLADTLMYHAKREKAGALMATSMTGDPYELAPFAPETNSLGRQRATVRAIERCRDVSSRGGLSQPSAAT